MKVGEWLKTAETVLKASAIPSFHLDALILLETNTDRDRGWLLANPGYELDVHSLKQANQQLNRRKSREPIAYITGVKDFYGLQFKVTPGVLIPRPETEMMVEYAIRHTPKQARALEIGTGSGAIAVAVKFNRSDIDLTATDISAAALAVAQSNASRHGVQINFLCGDLFAPIAETYLTILANLPYIPTGTRHETELDYEPRVALFAGADGLNYYRSFINRLRAFLLPGGWALIEASPTQRAALEKLAKGAGLGLEPLSEYIFKLS